MRAVAVRVHALREMLRLLRRQPGSFFLAVLLAAAAFTVPLAVTSIARSVAPLAQQLPLGPEISLFLSMSASPAEIRQLQSQLTARPGVTQVEWITRDAALRALAQRTGSSALGELKANPLPDVLVVALAPQTAPAEVEQALGELRKLPRVESIAADTDWHRKLAAILRAAAAAGALLGAVAATMLVLIVLASVQLQLSSAAEYVRVLRLVGADARFIVRPFVYAGALTLAGGAFLAAGLTSAGLIAAAPQAAGLAQLYGATLSLQPLPLEWLAAVTAGSAVVGGAVAALATRRAMAVTR